MEQNDKINILVADERSDERHMIIAMLLRPELNFLSAANAGDVLRIAAEAEIALLLLDQNLAIKEPGLVKHFQSEPGRDEPPIIFLCDQEHVMNRADPPMDANVIDYLIRPLNIEMLRRKVNPYLALCRQKKDLERTGRELLQKMEELKRSKSIIEKQNQKLSELVIRDSLTGLFNRHHLQNILPQEFERARRYRTDLSCLMMDLDFFKQINDYFGHACGDYVLREFSACLARFTRKADIAFRYGGEEFILLMPHTDTQGGQSRAEAIRKWSEARMYNDGRRKISVTVSIGIASLCAHQPQRPMDLIVFADQALYQAKAEGRNRVKLYKDTFLGFDSRQNDKPTQEKDYQFLKDNLTIILEKTKKASLESLELLIKELGGDRYKQHNLRVMRYFGMFAEKLGLAGEMIEPLKRAAIFHECFRVLLSESILQKKEHLTREERKEIEAHPAWLAELTELFNFFAEEREILLYHHESFDGSGYPKGLNGEQIPIGARLFSIVEALVAMTSPRPYRKRMSIDDAMQELRAKSGTQFDPRLVRVAETLVEGIPEEAAIYRPSGND